MDASQGEERAYRRGSRLAHAPQAPSDAMEEALKKLRLNARENEIAVLVAKGLTNEEIAGQLFISVKTVKNNNSIIYKKTGLRNRVELANHLQGRSGG